METIGRIMIQGLRVSHQVPSLSKPYLGPSE